jgi:beta-lactamase regulating signal transducer with metallopeptidase domain
MTFLPLFDHLWQSTFFAVVAGLLVLGLRANRARVRHAIWLAASVKFLLPLSLLIGLGSRVQWNRNQQPENSNLAFMVVQASEPFTAPQTLEPERATVRPPATSWTAILTALWACGFIGISCAWWIRWRRIRAIVMAGTPVDLQLPIRAVVSPGLVEPGIYGIARPVLVLPSTALDRLTPAQLDTVIAHELEHVRHRDNLSAAFQMFVETVFWFHPIVWWIGKQMLQERERACDEGVLRAGGQPRVYAEAMLTVCKLYLESPLRCVSGIAGGNLKRRIEEIMKRRIARELHLAKKVVLAVAGLVFLAAPVFVGILHAPATWAQSPALPAAPAALEVHAPAAAKPRAAVAAPVVAIPQVAVPQVATPQDPQIPAGTSPAEARRIRAEFAKANFQNHVLIAAYTSYGPPNQRTRVGDVETWQYDYLDLYQGKVILEFSPRTGARVTWPPQPAFEGGTTVEPAVQMLAKELARELKLPNDTVRGGMPGRLAYVEPSLRVNRAEQFVDLMIPLDGISGPVDILAQVKDEYKSTVANMRERVDSPAGAWQGTFVLLPGPYTCHVVLREQSSGLIYGETIAFQIKR